MMEVYGDDDWSQSFIEEVFLCVDAAEASAKRVKRTPPPSGDGGAAANHLASTSYLPPPPPSAPPLSLVPCQYNVNGSSDWADKVKSSIDFASTVHISSKEEEEKPMLDSKRRGNHRRVLPSSIVAAPYPRAPPPWNGSEVEEAALGLKQILEDKKREVGAVAIGFDIEWKPSFIEGVLPGKAAVVQICFDRNFCHVMHIIHSGIPPTLLSLLEDPSLLKVGVGINGDGVKMYEDHKVCLKSLKDLSCLANQKLGGVPRQWSLKGLTEMLVSKELPKTKKIRCGNWEAGSLSKSQLEYAATDAFVSWLLYEVLKGYPDAEDKDVRIQE